MTTIQYFSASWCNPCRQILPKVQQACDKAGITLLVTDIDTPHGQASAEAHRITGVPRMYSDAFGLINPAEQPWSATRKLIEGMANG